MTSFFNSGIMNKNTYVGLAILCLGLAFSFDFNLSTPSQGPEWLWAETPLVAMLLASISLISLVLYLAADEKPIS